MALMNRWYKRGAVLVLLCTVCVLAFFYAPAVLFYLAQTHLRDQEPAAASFRLDEYRAVIKDKKVQGIERNLSGLTFHPGSGTLFGVTNSPAQIVEMSLTGDTLHVWRVRGAGDTEGIAHWQDNRFFIVNERKNHVWLVHLDRNVHEISIRDAPRAELGIQNTHANLGVEALSWSRRDNSLWAGQEKWPLRVLRFDMALSPEAPLPGKLPLREAGEWSAQGLNAWLLSDLASLTVDEATGHLLLLSQESSVMVEYTPEGRPLSVLPLWRGMHGLDQGIPQPEGVALDGQGHVYIVSEPNLFYRFERVAGAKPSHAAPVRTLTGELESTFSSQGALQQ